MEVKEKTIKKNGHSIEWGQSTWQDGIEKSIRNRFDNIKTNKFNHSSSGEIPWSNFNSMILESIKRNHFTKNELSNILIEIANQLKSIKKLTTILFIFVSIFTYSQDYLPYQDEMNGKFGYIDELGEIKIKAKYLDVSLFYDDISIVNAPYNNPKNKYLKYKKKYINKSKKTIYSTNLSVRLNNFSNGYGLVEVLDHGSISYVFFINKFGKIVSKKYDEAFSFSENLAVVIKNEKVFVIDTSFKVISELPIKHYDFGRYFGYFHNDLMPIKNIKEKWGFINSKGKIIIKPQYLYVSDFINGRAKVMKDRWIKKSSIIDKKGLEIYEFQIDHFSHAYLTNNSLIYSPERTELKIVDLKDFTTTEIEIHKNSQDYNDNIRPKFFGNKIFYDGNLIDLNGNILWTLKGFYKIKEIYYNKYILIDIVSEDENKLININGKEIITQLY